MSTTPELLVLAIETSNPTSDAPTNATDGPPGVGASDHVLGAGVGLALVSPRGVRLLAHEPVRPVGAPTGRVATSETGARAGVEAGGPRGDRGDTLFPALAGLFERSGRSPRELDRVIVSVGPGGYTGVRVACAAGKMIAEGARACQSLPNRNGEGDYRPGGAGRALCTCIGVPSHRSAIATFGLLHRQRAGERVSVALASKTDSAWISFPISPGKPISPSNAAAQVGPGAAGADAGRVLRAHDLESWRENAGDNARPSVLLADGFFPAPLRAAAERAGVRVDVLHFSVLGLIAAAQGLAFGDAPATSTEPGVLGAGVDPSLLNPLYPREPDAVTLWRQRHPRGV
ncbi:MAG TPA: hypothetical protein PL072_04440 [Phycisphaerales bacterium]|nr:hypothetical protein [Phycisphaerales bacterium]